MLFLWVLPGADISRGKLEDAGVILADTIRQYMQDMGVVNGLSQLGYSSEDIPQLVEGTLPQVCVCVCVCVCMCVCVCVCVCVCYPTVSMILCVGKSD